MRTCTILLLIVLLVSPAAFGQRKKRKKEKENASEQVESKSKRKKPSKFKPYKEVITASAKSNEGLFTVHKVGKDYFYEVPNDLLGKEMLWVTRIVSLPSGFGGGYTNAGSKTNTQVISWERFQDKLLIKIKSYDAVAEDSLPIYKSVQANNFEPTFYALGIEAFNPDSTAAVVKVTDLFSKDVKAISGLRTSVRTKYAVWIALEVLFTPSRASP